MINNNKGKKIRLYNNDETMQNMYVVYNLKILNIKKTDTGTIPFYLYM